MDLKEFFKFDKKKKILAILIYIALFFIPIGKSGLSFNPNATGTAPLIVIYFGALALILFSGIGPLSSNWTFGEIAIVGGSIIMVIGLHILISYLASCVIVYFYNKKFSNQNLDNYKLIK